jgi:hypothetical protein
MRRNPRDGAVCGACQSSVGSKYSSSRSVVGEWRNDEVLAEWYRGVQERKQKGASRVYKQAIKVLRLMPLCRRARRWG